MITSALAYFACQPATCSVFRTGTPFAFLCGRRTWRPWGRRQMWSLTRPSWLLVVRTSPYRGRSSQHRGEPRGISWPPAAAPTEEQQETEPTARSFQSPQARILSSLRMRACGLWELQAVVTLCHAVQWPEAPAFCLKVLLAVASCSAAALLIAFLLLAACRFSRAMDLYREMMQRGVTPDARTYNTLLYAGAQAKLPGKVLEVYGMMIAAGLPPNLSSRLGSCWKLWAMGGDSESSTAGSQPVTLYCVPLCRSS